MKLKIYKIILVLIFILAVGLRFYHLGANPPSPYWEEAAIGYDAYSILKTGRDFHGNRLPLVAFESFGDYKPSLYFYATIPPIAVFGLNTFAVRFPSALFGSLTVILIYWLVKELFSGGESKNKNEVPILGLWSSFFLAISPWHLQLSRAGFEANLGLFLVVLGSWSFLKGLKRRGWLFLAVFSWSLSLYCYHANRIFVPLLGLGFGLCFFKNLLKKKWLASLSIVLFIALVWPILSLFNQPQIKQRFAETSALATLEPIIKSNQLIKADKNGLLSRLIHHRFWHYQGIFFDHYLDHFDLNYLFLSGDSNPRHSTQLVGNLYLLQLPLLIWGIITIFQKHRKAGWLLLIWLLLSPIPAGFTKATPHALRSLPMLIPLTIFTSYGLMDLFRRMNKSNGNKLLTRVFGGVLLLFVSFEFSRYLYIYHHDYPRLYSQHWQYGYQEMIEYVSNHQQEYDHIYITRELGRPSAYYWFYTKTNPRLVQAENNQVKKDQGEYLEFQDISFSSPQSQLLDNSLIVLGSNSPMLEDAIVIKEIYSQTGDLVFRIYEN